MEPPPTEVAPAPVLARPVRPAWSREPITASSVLAHVAALPAGRAAREPAHEATRQLLRERLDGWGHDVLEQRFAWEGEPGLEFVNFEVRIPGEDPDGPVVLVGAHYDSVRWSPGADDNGSGTAIVLELARRLAGRSLPAEVRLLWFDMEERGMVGSRHYALALPDEERARLVGLVNLETVGYTDRRPGSQTLPPGSSLLHDTGDVGDFVMVLGNQASAPFAGFVGLGLSAEAGDAMRVEVFSALPGAGWVMPDSRRSDHSSFWDIGVPAVMLTDTANFRNPNYHRRSDTVETLDGEFLAAAARGVERAVLLLAVEGEAVGF